jgi:hypothetical protein
LQTQRIQLYGEYLAAVDEAYGLLRRMLPAPILFGGLGFDNLQEFPIGPDEDFRAMQDALREADTLGGQIQVIGGQEVDQLATALRDHLNEAQSVLAFVVGCHTGDFPAERCTPDAVESGGEAYWSEEQHASNRKSYLRAAQEQLEIAD